MNRMPVSAVILFLFGGLQVFLGMIGQGDPGPRFVLLGFGTVSLVAAGVLELLARRR
jgi:hypothetical protein